MVQKCCKETTVANLRGRHFFPKLEKLGGKSSLYNLYPKRSNRMYHVNTGQHLLFSEKTDLSMWKCFNALRWSRNAPSKATSESECGANLLEWELSAHTSRETGITIPAPHALFGYSEPSPITEGLSHGCSIITWAELGVFSHSHVPSIAERLLHWQMGIGQHEGMVLN